MAGVGGCGEPNEDSGGGEGHGRGRWGRRVDATCAGGDRGSCRSFVDNGDPVIDDQFAGQKVWASWVMLGEAAAGKSLSMKTHCAVLAAFSGRSAGDWEAFCRLPLSDVQKPRKTSGFLAFLPFPRAREVFAVRRPIALGRTHLITGHGARHESDAHGGVRRAPRSADRNPASRFGRAALRNRLTAQ